MADNDIEALAAFCKDAFYEARDAGRTMHQAADDAASRILASDWLARRDAAQRAAALRDAADEFDLIWNRGHDNSVHPGSYIVRDRADRIEQEARDE